MAAATVAEYLLQQLQESGVDHVFGVPGDYVLGFYKLLAASPLRHIGTTREDTSAFAADGYARCRGIGALAVTYGVGALSVVNAIAGAYAETSPVVVISSAPGISEQRKDPWSAKVIRPIWVFMKVPWGQISRARSSKVPTCF